MNEQLQLTINDILTKSMEAFNAGADWLAGEIPDVVTQLLMWHMIESIMWLILSVVILVTAIAIDIKLFKSLKEKDVGIRSDDFVFGYIFLGCLIRGVVAAIICSTFSITWLQIWIAPKLYLLEYAASLVK